MEDLEVIVEKLEHREGKQIRQYAENDGNQHVQVKANDMGIWQ